MPPDLKSSLKASEDELSREDKTVPGCGSGAWTVLAHVVRPQGRKGEVLAELFSDLPEYLDTSKRVFLAEEDFAGTIGEARSIEVASFWLPAGKNAGRIVLHFQGIVSIEAAEQLAGLDVLVPSSERPTLDDDESYVSDLVGCTLFDCNGDGPGVEVGRVTGIQFAMTPDGSRRLQAAASLLAVQTSDGEEVLVPYVKEFLVTLATAQKRIEMRLPQGLLEINRPG